MFKRSCRLHPSSRHPATKSPWDRLLEGAAEPARERAFLQERKKVGTVRNLCFREHHDCHQSTEVMEVPPQEKHIGWMLDPQCSMCFFHILLPHTSTNSPRATMCDGGLVRNPEGCIVLNLFGVCSVALEATSDVVFRTP